MSYYGKFETIVVEARIEMMVKIVVAKPQPKPHRLAASPCWSEREGPKVNRIAITVKVAILRYASLRIHYSIRSISE
jgi:hypothetical protein